MIYINILHVFGLQELIVIILDVNASVFAALPVVLLSGVTVFILRAKVGGGGQTFVCGA